MNFVIPILKHFSWPDVQKKRKEIADYLKDTPLDFFNGGGTSTILRTVRLLFANTHGHQRNDPTCTEIAVGSGFLQSHIFDYHRNRVNTNCAFLFALRITRIPKPGVVTCQSGGFISRFGCIGYFLLSL